jgi:hypothetical protein
MLGHQEFSRGYEGGLVLSVRDLSLLDARAGKTCRAGGPAKGIHPRALSEADKANLNRQLAVHVQGLKDAKASRDQYKALVRSTTDAAQKKKYKELQDSAQQMISYEQGEIDSCNDLLREG